MITLALKKILRNKLISFVTLGAISLSTLLFLLLNNSLKDYSDRVTARAKEDILVAGPKFSGIDLVLKALYFRHIDTPNFQYRFIEHYRELATAVPLFYQYNAKGFPICGTSLDYFKVRILECKKGRLFTNLGECVIGSDLAEKHNLNVDDFLISDPDNFLNPAGNLPLKMKICGILEKSNPQDDNAIFCNLKTAWTIHGLGHTHEGSLPGPDYSINFVEITPESLKNFHFHGNQSEYPLTAILLKPNSPKEQALMLAQSAVSNEVAVLKPQQGLTGFINMLFHLDSLFAFVLCLTMIVILTLFSLTFYLSLKLRLNEKELLDSLGAQKGFFARQVTLEWAIKLTIGILLGVIIFFALTPIINELLNSLIRN